VTKRSPEPRWLSRLVVDAIHNDQLREHGGLPGIRDENVLESALARPRQKWHYAEETDLATLAAAPGFGLVKNHPYRDGIMGSSAESVGEMSKLTVLLF